MRTFISLVIVATLLPLHAETEISVEGRGIDIRPLKVGIPLYPTGSSPKFSSYRNNPHAITVIADAMKSSAYATIPVLPNDKRKDYALNRVKADTPGPIFIGIANPTFKHPTWKRTPGVFRTKTTTYYRYQHPYPKARQWLDLPKPGRLPLLVYGKPGHLTFANPQPVPGTIIVSETAYPGSQAVFNPSLIILPNGDYLANCSMRGRCPTFRSSDKGRTWQLVSDPNLKLSFQSLFHHRGKVYLLGKAWFDRNAPDDKRTATLYQSFDFGKTWSKPVYLPFLIAGGHKRDSAPSRMIEHQGRLVRALQVRTGEEWGPGFLSIDSNADLAEPDNWTIANGIIAKSIDEGDTLLTRKGRLVNLAKTQNGHAAKITFSKTYNASFNPDTDLVHLPGSDSKFSVRLDPVSDRYWALTSMGRNRSELHLFSSSDLKSFNFERKILDGRSNYFDGHNYPFMQIDGGDLIFVLRHAHENERGQPQRWHDANHLTFHRIKNFRQKE